MTTAGELIEEGRRTLRAVNHRFGYQGAERKEAREILAHVLGREPRDSDDVPAEIRRRFDRLIDRRATGEPQPYVVGWTEFRTLRLRVRPGVFVPRQTTEFLAEQAIRRVRLRHEPVAIDLACGIGPVALAVALSVPQARVYGVDLSRKAIVEARHNAGAIGLRNVRFLAGDLFAPLPRTVRADVVTIHPPYVARNEVRELPLEIKRFEPKLALTDGSDGLGLVRRVVAEAPDRLRPDGWLLIEVGAYIARTVKAIVSRAGYRDVRSTRGDMPWTRVLVGRRPR